MTEDTYKLFALDSNRIEGEATALKDQAEATQIAYELGEALTLPDILNLHSKCFQADWAGRWREVQVYIGEHIPPPPEEVAARMEAWYLKWDAMDAWEAHNTFEAIHPFQDGNGRLGRLIWLAKMASTGNAFTLPFLHRYYYQTLDHLTT